jgi:hypothetical protein
MTEQAERLLKLKGESRGVDKCGPKWPGRGPKHGFGRERESSNSILLQRFSRVERVTGSNPHCQLGKSSYATVFSCPATVLAASTNRWWPLSAWSCGPCVARFSRFARRDLRALAGAVRLGSDIGPGVHTPGPTPPNRRRLMPGRGSPRPSGVSHYQGWMTGTASFDARAFPGESCGRGIRGKTVRQVPPEDRLPGTDRKGSAFGTAQGGDRSRQTSGC